MCDEKTLREVFALFDKDKSGTIDAKELKEVVKACFEHCKEPADDKRVEETATAIMKAVDTGGDGSINVDEFIKFFK